MSGTSMAAPAVAGAIAVMLSETLAAGISMDSKKIRDAVIASARLAPPPGGAKWDARYGHGRISALSMLQTALPPVVAAPEPAPAAGAKRARPKGRRPQAKAASNRAAKATRRKALAASKRR
jgi:subtilisin family serine protease